MRGQLIIIIIVLCKYAIANSTNNTYSINNIKAQAVVGTCGNGEYMKTSTTPHALSFDVTQWGYSPSTIYECTYLRHINLQPAYLCVPDMIVHWCKGRWVGLIEYRTYLAANEQVDPVCYLNFRTDYVENYQAGEIQALEYLLQTTTTLNFDWCLLCSNTVYNPNL
jgi:hypothetical protein